MRTEKEIAMALHSARFELHGCESEEGSEEVGYWRGKVKALEWVVEK